MLKYFIEFLVYKYEKIIKISDLKSNNHVPLITIIK